MIANRLCRHVSQGARLLVIVALLTAIVPTGQSASAKAFGRQTSNAVPLDDIERMAYHEITRWEVNVNTRANEAPILSDDGQTIAFSRSPGSGDPTTPNKIFAINADGTGEREIDSFTPFCYCGSLLDISGDGSRVVSTDLVQLRVAETSGSMGRLLLALASNEIYSVRISGDGETILFRVYRDTQYRDSSDIIERGIYAIDVDGSNLRQLVSPADMAPVLGVDLANVPFFDGGNIDLSHTGDEIVFGMFIDPISGGAGQGLFAVGGDGGTPRMLVDRQAFVMSNTISNDGTTVAYVITDVETGIETAGAIQFNGSNNRVLAHNTGEPPVINMGLPAIGQRIALNHDGTRLLLGSTGLLIDTQSGAFLQLGVNAGVWQSGDPWPLMTDGLSLPTMNRDATRILYLSLDDRNISQLTILDLNPADLGAAPSISEAAVDPDVIPLASAGSATVTAKVATANPVLRVGVVVLVNGLRDPNVSASYAGPLADDGLTNGDATSGDDVYTTDALRADCCAVEGQRVVRIQAETLSTDGYRHATAVNLNGFTVEGAVTPTTVPSPSTDAATETPDAQATITPDDATATGSTGSSGDWTSWTGEPDPADCTIAPVTAEYVITEMTESIDNPPSMLLDDPESDADLPTGSPVDGATADAVLSTVWEVNACVNAGAFGQLLGLFTPDGVQRLFVSAFAAIADPSSPDQTMTEKEIADLQAAITNVMVMPPTPLAETDRSQIDQIRDVQGLPDGRIMVVVVGDTLVANGEAVMLFELVGDRWLIAEIHTVGDDPQLTSPL